MKVFGTTTASFYTMLVIAMIVCYYVLNKTLKKFTHNSLERLRNLIGRLFCVLLIGYILRSLVLDL